MRAKLPTELSEKEFQQQFIDLARMLGYRVVHFRAAMTKHGWRTAVAGDGKGFPDNVLVSADRKRVIYVELKSNAGKLSSEQQKWLDDLRAAGQEAYVWKPDDFDEIAKCLQGRP